MNALRSTAQLSVFFALLKSASSTFAKLSHTLWKSKLMEVTLPRRLTGLSPNSSRKSLLVKSSKTMNVLTQSVLLKAKEPKVLSRDLVSTDFLVRLTEVFVRSLVSVLGTPLLSNGQLLAVVSSVTTAVPKSTRRSIESVLVPAEELPTTLLLMLMQLRRTSHLSVDSLTTVL